MVNVEEIFNKLENGEVLMEHEIIFLKELLRLVDELYGKYYQEWQLAEQALQDRMYYKRFRKIKMEDTYLKDVIGTPKKDVYEILLAHNPEYFEEYAAWGADLVLSGHVHGGIMRLPVLGGVISPKLVLFPKYDGGRFEEKNATMILSRGLGMHTLPIRIFNPAELVVIHLLPCK